MRKLLKVRRLEFWWEKESAQGIENKGWAFVFLLEFRRCANAWCRGDGAANMVRFLLGMLFVGEHRALYHRGQE